MNTHNRKKERKQKKNIKPINKRKINTYSRYHLIGITEWVTSYRFPCISSCNIYNLINDRSELLPAATLVAHLSFFFHPYMYISFYVCKQFVYISFTVSHIFWNDSFDIDIGIQIHTNKFYFIESLLYSVSTTEIFPVLFHLSIRETLTAMKCVFVSINRSDNKEEHNKKNNLFLTSRCCCCWRDYVFDESNVCLSNFLSQI